MTFPTRRLLRPVFRVATRVAACVPVLLFGAGCEEGIARPGGETVDFVAVDPPTLTLGIGDRFQLREIVRNPGGFLLPLEAAWTSENSSVASVDSLGVVTALAAGQVTIRADVQGNVGQSVITVEAPTPPPWVQHTCGVAGVGQFQCWGRGLSGELGLGDRQARGFPTRVPEIEGAVSVTAGAAHTCGLTTEGLALCWGRGFEGQLGNRQSGEFLTPQQVLGQGTFTRLSAGGRHTCGLTDGSQVLCWGWNVSGQLGNATTVTVDVPVGLEAGPARWTDVSAGALHSCAVGEDERIWCWGENEDGQLGDGTRQDRNVPTPVASELRFKSVSAGLAHTCGVTTSGAGYCWGQNSRGQHGDGSLTDHDAPIAVSLGITFQRIVAGGGHTCGLAQGGAVWCWGSGGSGEIGDGGSALRGNPTRVPLEEAVFDISVGAAHSCAIDVSLTTWCWGANGFGQLGSPGSASPLPRQIQGIQFVQIGG